MSSPSGLLTSVSELFLTLGKRHFTQDGRWSSSSSSTESPSSASLFRHHFWEVFGGKKNPWFQPSFVERFYNGIHICLFWHWCVRWHRIWTKKYKIVGELERSTVRKFVRKVGQKLVHGAPKMHNLLAIKVNVKWCFNFFTAVSESSKLKQR